MLWLLEEKDEDVLGSINDQVWEVTENDYAIIDPDDPTNQDKINKQCNTMAPNTIYNAIDSKVFEQIKDCEKTSEVWKRLEKTYESTPAMKSAKLYILKDKLTKLQDEGWWEHSRDVPSVASDCHTQS